MYYLTEICFLCLKSNIKLQSVLTQDTDGVVFNEKLRCFIPEIIDSTPDVHKLACTECLEKLRISYDFKQTVIYNNTIFKDYIDKLQCQHKIHQQLFVVLAHSKRKINDPTIRDITAKKLEITNEKLNKDSLMITNENFNLTSTNQKQLNTYDHSCQLTTNENFPLSTKLICQSEEIHLNTENVGKNENTNEKLDNENYNLTSTNQQQLNTYDHSCQLTTNENVAFFTKFNCQPEEINLKTENIEKVHPITAIEEIHIKEEPLDDDNFTTTYSDEESMEFEENSCGIEEDDFNTEMDEEENTTHNLKNEPVVKHKDSPPLDSNFCATCHELLFKDLNNINLHLNVHIQISNCSTCEKSVEDIDKFKRHMLKHCGATTQPKDIGVIGDKVQCANCKMEFDNLKSLKNHIYMNYIKNLSCALCSKSFYCRSSLMRHVLMLHCNLKRFQCKVCDKRFTTKKSVENHMIYLHYSGKTLICKICKQKFSNPKSLHNHIVKSHGIDKVDVYSEYKNQHGENCAVGEKVTETDKCETFAPVQEPEKVYVKQEVQFTDDDFSSDEESKEPEEHKCGIETNSWDFKTVEEDCNNSLHSNSNDSEKTIDAVVTEQNVPNLTKSFCESDATTNLSDSCDICQEMYKYLNNLLQHLNVHMKESSCTLCKESIENISNFQRRMLVPCGSKCQPHDEKTSETYAKIPCVVCKKEYHLYSLKKHIYAHIHNLTCVICSKSFIGTHGKQNLQRHLLVHCDVKPYQCEICSKRFTVKESLKYHMNNIHAKVSKQIVTCQYCKQLFSETYLRRHIVKQHAGETFKCEICKKVYIQYKDLEKHLKVHENRDVTTINS